MEELERALEVINRHRALKIEELTIEEAKTVWSYCFKVKCPSCELRKRFGKCPIVVSVP